MSGEKTVSVVIPVHNEADYIEDTVSAVLRKLEALGGSHELLLSEDGSRDGSRDITRRIARENECVTSLNSDVRLGKGAAVKRGFDSAAGDILVFFDADLSTGLEDLERLIDPIRTGAADIAIGTRYGPREVDRSTRRQVSSSLYNHAVRLLLGSELQDHQCGFKGFSRAAYNQLHVEEDGFFWDTSVLLRAQELGLDIAEVPVSWSPRGGSKVSLSREGIYFAQKLLSGVLRRLL